MVVVALKVSQVLKPRINHPHRLSILIVLDQAESKVLFKGQIMDLLHSKKDHPQVMELDQETIQITKVQIIELNSKSLILT